MPIQATRIERGWRYLQADNLRNAEREFQAALKLQPSFHPAETGLGYLELARARCQGRRAAIRSRAWSATRAYVPALVGRGQALLELGRDGDALASFEAALKADPSLTDLQGRIEVLRFRARAGQPGARQGGERRGAVGLRRAPPTLRRLPRRPNRHFSIAIWRSSSARRASRRWRSSSFARPSSLDPADARSLAQIGAILEEQGDVAGALDAYEKARALDPAEVPAERLAAAARRGGAGQDCRRSTARFRRRRSRRAATSRR